jgi:3-oxoacyl-[acyl-carrier-protein] synthase-1
MPVTGHIAGLRAVEAEGIGKMIGLGVGALKDLCESTKRNRHDTKLNTGFYMVLPNYSLRQETFCDVEKAIATDKSDYSSDSEEEDGEDSLKSLRFADQCNRYLVDRLIRAIGIELNVKIQKNIYGDQCDFLIAIREAIDDLESGKVDRCIVGGVDSFLEPFSLEWAIKKNRLKGEDTPCGFLPGEAAVFIELQRSNSRGKIAEPVEAILTEPAFDQEPANAQAGEISLGVGLASVIKKVLSYNHEAMIGLVIGNLNGEVGRAQDWGYAVNRLIGQFPFLNEVRTWYPAESFGETGCASVGLAIGVGIQSFKRGYAKTNDILIWCSSETRNRGAVLLKKADPS